MVILVLNNANRQSLPFYTHLSMLFLFSGLIFFWNSFFLPYNIIQFSHITTY